MSEIALGLSLFFARTADMAMSSFRVIMTVKGRKLFASLIGVVEAAIWFIVVKEAMNTDTTSVWAVCGYAFGFGAGTYLGTLLSSLFIKSNIEVQIITSDTNDNELIEDLRKEGFAVSVFDCHGMKNEKHMLYVVINSKKYKTLVEIAKRHDPHAFVSANENKYILNGYFSNKK